MHILLVGEYSRLHNSLKDGLQALGHTVVLVSDGDGFKQYPSDHSVAARFVSKGLPNMVRQAIYRLTKQDVAFIERGIHFYFLMKKLKGFDVVQLINESPVKAGPRFEKFLLKKLFRQNKKAFLMSCGVSPYIVEAMASGTFTYSLLDGVQQDSEKEKYSYIFKNFRQDYKGLHDFVVAHVQGVIASDMDYYIPYQNHPKFLGLVPNPVNLGSLPFIPMDVSGTIIIFLGINRGNYHAKGINFFEEALQIIQKKYGNKVEVVVAENIPYAQYINLYNSAHIVLDQVYAYDQGYNALEAMAKGKVVFTGAEKEFNEYYNLTQPVAINALPDAQAIANNLSYLIDNPEEIIATGQRARAFIEKQHEYVKVAGRYLEVWKSV